jgi:hypothetical protein
MKAQRKNLVTSNETDFVWEFDEWVPFQIQESRLLR